MFDEIFYLTVRATRILHCETGKYVYASNIIMLVQYRQVNNHKTVWQPMQQTIYLKDITPCVCPEYYESNPRKEVFCIKPPVLSQELRQSVLDHNLN